MLNKEDSEAILRLVLGEFPITELHFKLPDWTELLPEEHPINKKMMDMICGFSSGISKFSDVDKMLSRSLGITKCSLDSASGSGSFEIPLTSEEYYSALGECSGMALNSDKELFAAVKDMARIKEEYEKIKDAISDVNEKGYGIVMPTADELMLSEPELVKQGGSYGIKFSAEADSIHMIKTTIRADVCPTFGTEEQSEEVMRTMMREFEENPKALLESKLLGRSLYELVNDGMNSKLLHMPDESRAKMGQTIEKIINEGAAGLICIII
jgi:stage IV sporulation protein A